MVGSMIKRGLIGAAIGAGALFLVFGTHAPSYVRTAFHKVKRDVKQSVPMPFDIERARDEIAGLEPAIHENIEKLARAEAKVEDLDKEIASIRTSMDGEKKALLTLRKSLETGEYRLAGHSRIAYTEDEVKADLARRFDTLKNQKNILIAKETTLKAKQSEAIAFRQQLDTMISEKKRLSTKLDEIEARLRQIEAAQAANQFQHIDGSALSHVKETVSDLEGRLKVMARTAEIESHYAETGVPVISDPSRDVIKEIDNEFGQGSDSSVSKPGKSL